MRRSRSQRREDRQHVLELLGKLRGRMDAGLDIMADALSEDLYGDPELHERVLRLETQLPAFETALRRTIEAIAITLGLDLDLEDA